MNNYQFSDHDVLGKFYNDFISEFGVLDTEENSTDGWGETYWGQWKGNKYFNDEIEGVA